MKTAEQKKPSTSPPAQLQKRTKAPRTLAQADATEFQPGEEYRGTLLEKVNRQRLTEYLVLEKVKFKMTATLKELVDVYADHYLEQEKSAVDTFECDVCNSSTLVADVCPVCGAGAEAAASPAEPAVVEKAAPAAEAVEESAQPAKRPKGTKPVQTALTTNEDAHVGEVVVPGSLADLDASVATIRRFTNGTIEQLYALGKEIDKVLTSGSWKLRVGKDDGPKYKVVGEFFESECGLSRTAAYQAAAVSRSFKLEEAKRFGFDKLKRVLSVPAEQRARLLSLAGDATNRELREEIKNLAPAEKKPRKAKTTSGRMVQAEARSDAAPSKPRKPGEITTTFTLGKNELKLKRKGEKVLTSEEVLVDGCKVTYTINLETLKMVIDRKPPV